MARPSPTRHVQVTFSERSEAQKAAAALRDQAGVDVSFGAEETEASLRSEMREEVEATVVGPGNIGPFTKGMSRGLVIWVPIATVAGAVLGFLLGLLPWGYDRTLTLVIATICGAVAGATAGFSFGGFLRSRKEGEGQQFAAERGTVVGIRAESDEALERAIEIAGRFRPERVDRVTEEGTPMWASSPERVRPVRGQVPATPGEEEQPR